MVLTTPEYLMHIVYWLQFLDFNFCWVDAAFPIFELKITTCKVTKRDDWSMLCMLAINSHWNSMTNLHIKALELQYTRPNDPYGEMVDHIIVMLPTGPIPELRWMEMQVLSLFKATLIYHSFASSLLCCDIGHFAQRVKRIQSQTPGSKLPA